MLFSSFTKILLYGYDERNKNVYKDGVTLGFDAV
jgi:hypothetical protein